VQKVIRLLTNQISHLNDLIKREVVEVSYHEKGMVEAADKLKSYRLERIECETAIQQLEKDAKEAQQLL
jgi:phage anti-repressor protein